jgi:hypothetical protein
MNMQKRNIEIKCRLNRKEADALNKRVKKSGLSRESYIRQLFCGLEPTDAPQPDYFDMKRELHAIGTNLNQIAHKAHVLNVIDVQRDEQQSAMLNKAIIEITHAVMLPRRMERKIE